MLRRLHPDRGGPWTNARQQLWHEVQKAWAVGDADWLARLPTLWIEGELTELRRAWSGV